MPIIVPHGRLVVIDDVVAGIERTASGALLTTFFSQPSASNRISGVNVVLMGTSVSCRVCIVSGSNRLCKLKPIRLKTEREGNQSSSASTIARAWRL